MCAVPFNAYTAVCPRSHVPIAYEARPMRIAYPSKLSAMCHASGSGYGV